MHTKVLFTRAVAMAAVAYTVFGESLDGRMHTTAAAIIAATAAFLVGAFCLIMALR